MFSFAWSHAIKFSYKSVVSSTDQQLLAIKTPTHQLDSYEWYNREWEICPDNHI